MSIDGPELPEVLRWNPHWVFDPVPEWWLREIGVEIQRELVVIRLQTAQKVLEAQAEGLARAAALVAKTR
jgi:hypothetical protein